MACVKVELSRQNRKAGATLFAMNKITQDMRFKQAAIEYSLKHGVTKAAIRYKTSRQNIYRWRKKYDGSIQSLADRSHRPHSHPKQHTDGELKLIQNMRRRNPNAGLVVFWVKLRQRGYSRSISGLYRVLRRIGGMAVKLPNPKYIPKPYEKMTYPGQRVQIDIKYVPTAWLEMPRDRSSISLLSWTSIAAFAIWRPLMNSAPTPQHNFSSMWSSVFPLTLNVSKRTMAQSLPTG